MELVVVLMFMKVFILFFFFKFHFVISLGPQSIGTRIRSESYLVPGMILSDGLVLVLRI